MRKIGVICAALGTAFALILGFLQRGDWFQAERVRAMSELAEFVVSFFWASVVLCILGLILIVRSTYIRDDEATFADYLPEAEEPDAEELVWTCPRCGAENPDAAVFCMQCGYQDGGATAFDRAEENWQCPVCGCVWNDDASVCTNCGYHRFG